MTLANGTPPPLSLFLSLSPIDEKIRQKERNKAKPDLTVQWRTDWRTHQVQRLETDQNNEREEEEKKSRRTIINNNPINMKKGLDLVDSYHIISVDT